MTTPSKKSGPERMRERVNEIFSEHYDRLASKIDLVFGYLFIFEWLLGIFLALVVSPRTWSGDYAETHIHVYAAIFLGGGIAALPVFLIFKNPGATLNRMVVAVSQSLYSVLFIHLTGGRIETHFHIFGSLALLAFYRDYRPVLIATILMAFDHLIRGFYWPESIFGILTVSPGRILEHGLWVTFADILILISLFYSLKELRVISENRAELEETSRIKLEKQAMEKDLAVTAAVQNLFLPKTDEFQTSKFTGVGYWRAAVQVGGDWWWHQIFPDGNVIVVIGDVTGHGPGPAMITASLSTAFQTLSEFGSLDDITPLIHKLNSLVLKFCHGNYLVSLNVVAFDARNNQLRAWGAAGMPVFILGKGGEFRLLSAHGLPLGTGDLNVSENRLGIKNGDRVFVFTDGLTELQSPDGRRLGRKNLKKWFEGLPRSDLFQARSALIAALEDFHGDGPLADDITFVLVDYR